MSENSTEHSAELTEPIGEVLIEINGEKSPINFSLVAEDVPGPLSSDAYSLLFHFLLASSKGLTPLRSPIWVAGVVSGIRPAALIGPGITPELEEFGIQGYLAMLEALPLSYRQQRDDTLQMWIASSHERFELLDHNPTDDRGHHVLWGLFLGYRHKTIIEFTRRSEDTTRSDRLDTHVVRGDVSPLEAAYIRFTPSTRTITEDTVDEEIVAGRAQARAFHKIAADWELSILGEYVDWVIDHERRIFEDVRSPPSGYLERFARWWDEKTVPKLNRDQDGV